MKIQDDGNITTILGDLTSAEWYSLSAIYEILVSFFPNIDTYTKNYGSPVVIFGKHSLNRAQGKPFFFIVKSDKGQYLLAFKVAEDLTYMLSNDLQLDVSELRKTFPLSNFDKSLFKKYIKMISKADKSLLDLVSDGDRLMPDNYKDKTNIILPDTDDTTPGHTPWTSTELKDSVHEYILMLQHDHHGNKYNKAQVYRNLSLRHGRGAKAYEFRMQNISYVFELLGRNWVKGLKPKRNITAKQVEFIEKCIADIEKKTFDKKASFAAEVRDLTKNKIRNKPKGNKNPQTTSANSSTYVRDPNVKAWVLQRAEGICECCNKKAPFETDESKLFLEVHHLIRLVDKGEDTVENCIGICPNCHRKLHYGKSRENITTTLIKKVKEKEAL